MLGTSSRVTDDIYRLTLADAGGKQTTTIVTGNHPYLLAAANDNNGFQGASPLVGMEGAKPLQAQPLLAANDNDPLRLRIAPDGDWKIVRFLKPGDLIRTALNGRLERGPDGPRLVTGLGNDLLTVVSIELDRSPRRVYNFEVADLKTYAVGELGEWVHNSAAGPSGKWKRYFITCSSRKEACDRAREAGCGSPIEHRNPRAGCPHFHPVDCKGNKIPGPHFEYPRRMGG